MANPPGPKAPGPQVVEKDATAAEEARQWHRELRHSVQTAKVSAKAVAACRKPGESDTPKHPTGDDTH